MIKVNGYFVTTTDVELLYVISFNYVSINFVTFVTSIIFLLKNSVEFNYL